MLVLFIELFCGLCLLFVVDYLKEFVWVVLGVCGVFLFEFCCEFVRV